MEAEHSLLLTHLRGSTAGLFSTYTPALSRPWCGDEMVEYGVPFPQVGIFSEKFAASHTDCVDDDLGLAANIATGRKPPFPAVSPRARWTSSTWGSLGTEWVYRSCCESCKSTYTNTYVHTSTYVQTLRGNVDGSERVKDLEICSGVDYR